jgi:hypothetical protein
LRRVSPFGPGAPSLKSPHTASIGTFLKVFAISSGAAGTQLPSTLTKARTLAA